MRRLLGNAVPSIAKVLLDLSTGQQEKTYDYLVPPGIGDELALGSTVIVPVRHSERVGYVVGLAAVSEKTELREITNVVGSPVGLSAKQIKLAKWLSEYYLTSFSASLKLSLPVGARRKLRQIVRLRTLEVAGEPGLSWLQDNGGDCSRKSFEVRFGRRVLSGLLKEGKVETACELTPPSVKPRMKEFAARVGSTTTTTGPKQRAILEELARKSPQACDSLLANCQTGRQTLKALEKKGLIQIFSRQDERPTETGFTNLPLKKINLNDEQQAAVNTIRAGLRAKKYKFILLDGVTGSGKTEVYIRGARECLNQGRSALFLVPEIALLPQLVEKLSLEFKDQVAVVHSGMKAGQRFDAWMAVASKKKNIIVGARSALFAPISNLGLIVIDEEHETSYKQNSSPRYDARTVALKQAQIHRAVVVMGSATPSLDSLSLAGSIGEHSKLTKRVEGLSFPTLRVIDMKKEASDGNYSLFSRDLLDRLTSTLDEGHKAILLINRRGFASFLLCRSCGHVPICDHCSVSLTFHRSNNWLRCHHCGFATRAPDKCPTCSSLDWRFSGASTQRVEDELRKAIENVNVIRMDADTTSRQGAYHKKLLEFYEGDRAILLGTQMVAKGLDFPEVATVGIINADTALNLPDFRAAERTAQLLIQVSGRSGRGQVPGTVIVQTYNPENYAITATETGYKNFCAEELENRRELGYPPFASVINLIISGTDAKLVEEEICDISRCLGGLRELGADILGPAPAPIAKIKGHWRWHLTITSKQPERVKYALRQSDRLKRVRSGLKLIIDVDPIWLL